MSNYTMVSGVTVNLITKQEYDTYVSAGIITEEERTTQAWIFTDDNFLSAENLAKLNALNLNDIGENNVIDGVTVNGAALTPDENKVVNIVVPTKLSDLQNDIIAEWACASSKPTYNYSEIGETPELATVATSGSYNDLTDKPTIPTGNAVTRIWTSN